MPNNEHLLKVKDHTDLRRDLYSNAVVDVNTDAYKRYKKIKESHNQQQERFESMESRINNMESDIGDIKSLLTKLLER
jgi:hypothetical protein